MYSYADNYEAINKKESTWIEWKEQQQKQKELTKKKKK